MFVDIGEFHSIPYERVALQMKEWKGRFLKKRNAWTVLSKYEHEIYNFILNNTIIDNIDNNIDNNIKSVDNNIKNIENIENVPEPEQTKNIKNILLLPLIPKEKEDKEDKDEMIPMIPMTPPSTPSSREPTEPATDVSSLNLLLQEEIHSTTDLELPAPLYELMEWMWQQILVQ